MKMEPRYIRKEGRDYRLTIANRKDRIAQVKATKEKIFFDETNGKVYICYNIEFHFPLGAGYIPAPNRKW